MVQYQQSVLKALSNKVNDFYLVGGTALSLFYFQHRLSVDLDFFTPKLSFARVKEIVDYLQKALECKEIKLIAQNLEKDKTKMLIYNINFSTADILKIDFVEDVFELITEVKTVDGIRVLSLEDIYIRKIYAVCGNIEIEDDVGRKNFIGGRVAAKDFYDLYFLSHVFMPLSGFAQKHCDAATKESLIRWFKMYDRMTMVDGILQIDTEKNVNAKSIEKHFAKEVGKIIEQQIGEI